MASISSVTKFLMKVFGSRNERIVKALRPLVEQINILEPEMKKLSDSELQAKTGGFKERIAAGTPLDDLLPEAFAVVREASCRTLKTASGVQMRHFDVQLIGGIVLHQGKISEMVTGEGKTLVATLPAYLNALTGKGVHIVTVNDYLARRDAEWMKPVFEFLGLTVGAIQSDMDNEERQKEYACDITYGTNNEFGFDYLRDNMKIDQSQQVQGELNYAVIDEVDSILIDEARTPLIISGPAEESTDKYYTANRAAAKLQRGRDYEVKEKEQQVVITEDGIERAEKLVGVDSFYTGSNMEWPHHIEQALRAKELYRRDTHYVVKDNQVVIVDEFTGRLMEGRVWSEGLHQAVEAKEGLKIKEENQTLATITFQNYFKLYNKISGMTGTAMTEAGEFFSIYGLDVVAIPTNKPLIRKDHPDIIYRTPAEKWKAIVNELIEYNKIGRPCLVGTISIENSEKLSGMLKRRGVPHDVLNAKHHEREAEIVSKSGQLGMVTIATNMAGRGTDITLGSFSKAELLAYWKKTGLAPEDLSADLPPETIEKELAEHWAAYYLDEETREKIPENDIDGLKSALLQEWESIGMHPLPLTFGEHVQDIGGLHVLGTERHEARRIDNQLRGRCGRQGDPGGSRFYLSLHDDLMRRFASERVEHILERLGMTEGQEISSPMVSRAVKRAQKKVESWNFDIRKNLLEYDEVMNEQRTIVYKQRGKILVGEELRTTIFSMFEKMTQEALRDYIDPRSDLEEEWPDEFFSLLELKYGIRCSKEEFKGRELDEAVTIVLDKYKAVYNEKVEHLGDEVMQRIERFILLNQIDDKWKDHLHAMDQLKAGIGMRAFAQIDPKVAYKREGYAMFNQMIDAYQEDVTTLVLKVDVRREDEAQLSKKWNIAETEHADFGAAQRQRAQAAQGGGQSQEKPRPIRNKGVKIGRNDPCPCGSGKKYKKCHGRGL